MRCPNDEATLVMSERSGIEIDYCPECRGVWLDRGELDKIIERSMTPGSSAQAGGVQPAYGQVPGGDCDDRGRYGNHQPKRRGFLKDLFD